MRDRDRTRDRRQLVAGLVLILIGGLFLADQFHIGDIGGLISDYWPFFVIIPGIVRLFDPDDRSGAVCMIGIGSWLLVANLGLFGLNWGNSWPVILIVIGGCMIFEGIFPQQRRRRRHRHTDADDPEGASS